MNQHHANQMMHVQQAVSKAIQLHCRTGPDQASKKATRLRAAQRRYANRSYGGQKYDGRVSRRVFRRERAANIPGKAG